MIIGVDRYAAPNTKQLLAGDRRGNVTQCGRKVGAEGLAKPFDTVDVLNAFRDQTITLTVQPPRVFFGNAGHPHHAPNFRLAATRNRPLFVPRRRPPTPPPPVVEAAPPPPPPIPPPILRVLGIVADASGALAMVRNAASDNILRARLGDDIEGWKVTQLELRSLVLSHDERSITFAMFTGANPGAERKLGSKLAVRNKDR